jgi:hypothetical protein
MRMPSMPSAAGVQAPAHEPRSVTTSTSRQFAGELWGEVAASHTLQRAACVAIVAACSARASAAQLRARPSSVAKTPHCRRPERTSHATRAAASIACNTKRSVACGEFFMSKPF